MQSGPGPRLACLSRHDALQPIHIHQPAPSLLPPPFMRLPGVLYPTVATISPSHQRCIESHFSALSFSFVTLLLSPGF
ncbi:hypothetical protein V8C26DRAFT_412778 [Trichoderma gracile]